MFLKNTIKNLLVTALFVSSIAISTNAEAARKPQLSTKATVVTCVAATVVVIAGLAIIASWVGAKYYFAHKLGQDRLQLLKKFNHSIPESELNAQDTSPEYEMPYIELKTEAQKVYNNNTLFPSTASLKYKFPVAALYTNIQETGFCRKISRLFIPKFKTLENELTTEAERLNKIDEFTNENKTYTKEREELKTKYREESSRWWSRFITGFIDILERIIVLQQNEIAIKNNNNNNNSSNNSSVNINIVKE